jgi:hypothetical protein
MSADLFTFRGHMMWNRGDALLCGTKYSNVYGAIITHRLTTTIPSLVLGTGGKNICAKFVYDRDNSVRWRPEVTPWGPPGHDLVAPSPMSRAQD